MKVVCSTALLLGLLISPALAGTIEVFINPAFQSVDLAAGTADVQILANIQEADAIFGWGIDLNRDNGNVSFTSGDVAVGPLFDPATAPDGDGLAGLVAPSGTVWGTNVLLATVTLTLNALGTTVLTPGDSNPFPFHGDLTEGFVGYPPEARDFRLVHYTGGSITITPEPAALSLLALGGLALLRRR